MKDCDEVDQSGVQWIGVTVSLCFWQRLWHASTNRQVSRGTSAEAKARVGLSRQNCCMHIHYGISWRYFKCLRSVAEWEWKRVQTTVQVWSQSVACVCAPDHIGY